MIGARNVFGIVSGVIAWSLVVAHAGCSRAPSDPSEKALAGFVDEMSSVNDVLDGVKDADDAKRAVPKIEAIAQRMDQLAKDRAAAPKLTEARAKEIAASFKAKLEEQEKRMTANSERLKGNQAVGEALWPYMVKLSFAADGFLNAEADRDRKKAAAERAAKLPSIAGPGALGGPNPRAGPGGGPSFPKPPTLDERRAQLEQKYGADKVATVEVTGVPDSVYVTAVWNRARKNAGLPGFTAGGGGSKCTIMLAPVYDLDALGPELDIGAVTETDPPKRVIRITCADAATFAK